MKCSARRWPPGGPLTRSACIWPVTSSPSSSVTRLSAPGAVRAAAGLAARLGVTVVRCPDRPGFLAGALLYPHLNDAVRMVQDGYASAADIDTAMMLGCGYPRGPLQLLDAAGPARALAVLTRMQQRYGDPAFAPAPLLAEHAAAGLAFR